MDSSSLLGCISAAKPCENDPATAQAPHGTCSSRSTSPGSSSPPDGSLPSSTKACARPALVLDSLVTTETIKPTSFTVRNTFIDFATDGPLVTDGRLHERAILSCPASRIGTMTLPMDYERVDTVASAAPSAPLLMQQAAVGTPEVPTVGSVEHGTGNCRPCAFFYKQGCENGVQCVFCHLCDPGEKRRRQKGKKASFRQREMEQQVDQHAEELPEPLEMATSGTAPLPLETMNSQGERTFSTTEFGCKRLAKPPALDLDGGIDVPMSLATPQLWPETPSECWSPTPADNESSTDIGAQVFLEPWGLAATMFSNSSMVPPMEDCYWWWQAAMPPPPSASQDAGVMLGSSAPPSESLTLPTCDSCEGSLLPTSSTFLRLADTILEPELGTAEFPTVGSMNHRVGACKPCAFLHKQGCGNGVNCEFCHLCDPAEKKRRQKLKKTQLKNMMRVTGTTNPIGAA